jgi:hypothetical protein
MDINSYETFKVVETMREYGAPYSALSVATGLTESKLKAYCRREDIGVCWISVYLSIIRREDTGRVFALEALLEEDTMRFCRERNRFFWRGAEKIGCIPKMAEAILTPYENRTGPVTSVFDLRRFGDDRERFLHRVAEIYGK